jgi:uncharacterized protein
MTTNEIKDKVYEYLLSRPEIKAGYLFGSRAKGEESKLSDIDIAILADEEILSVNSSYRYKAEVITDLIGILKTDKIDLVILNESPLSLSFRVIQSGIILCSKDEVRRVRFESKIMSLYFDRQYYYKRHAKAVIDHIAAEGIL